MHFSRRAALLAGVPAAVGGFFLGRQFPSKDWVRTKTLDQKFARWQVLYDLLDDKLACFIGHLGTVSPNTKFLIYSRGTDRNWVSPGFQQGWVGEIETRFPALNTNRVFTMTITPAMGEKRASFKHEETAKIMGKKVSEILGLKPGTVTPKQVVFLMDTSSRKGVYDEENMGTANTNAEELRKVLSRELNGDPNVKVALSFQTFNISDKSSKRNWDGEETVLKEKPSLVLFHRSAFFHVVNAEVGLGYPVYESPDSDKPVAWEEWKE